LVATPFPLKPEQLPGTILLDPASRGRCLRRYKYVGIDISKNKLDIAFGKDAKPFSLPYTSKGISTLIDKLSQHHVDAIVFEATGALENKLAYQLIEAGLTVVVVNPRHIKYFARSIGLLAKTDKIDAQTIAYYAELIKPSPRHILDKQTLQLKALVRRRKQLCKLITSEQNRLQITLDDIVSDSIKQVIHFLKKQLKDIEDQIEKLISSNDHWSQIKKKVLRRLMWKY